MSLRKFWNIFQIVFINFDIYFREITKIRLQLFKIEHSHPLQKLSLLLYLFFELQVNHRHTLVMTNVSGKVIQEVASPFVFFRQIENQLLIAI